MSEPTMGVTWSVPIGYAFLGITWAKEGNQHLCPSPVRRATSDEWWYQYGLWGPKPYTYMRVRDLPDSNPREYDVLYITWYNGTGFAVAACTADKPRFYIIGCEHLQETRKNLGRCYNQYTCVSCGYIRTVDSSD